MPLDNPRPAAPTKSASERVDVLLCVEHVARELDIACLIARRLAGAHGLRARVASLTGQPSALATPRPRVVAVPFFYSQHDWKVGELASLAPGARFVNLAFEQFLSPGNQEFKRPKDDLVRRRATHLAAGDEFAEFLRGHGVPAAHVRQVGSLTCQLYREPYRSFYAGRRHELARRHGLDARRPWLFFPENFAAAFFTAKDVANRVRQGARPADMEEYRRFSQRAFAATMAWCARAAGRGGVEVIIRPRPATPEASYRAAFESAVGAAPAGLRFIKDGATREWVLAADVVISTISTTLLEAAAAGKPAYIAAPDAIPASVRVPWNDLAPRLASEDEFLAAVDRAIQGADENHGPTPLEEHVRTRLLARGDAIANTADALALACAGGRAGAGDEAFPTMRVAWSTRVWRFAKDCWKRWKTRSGDASPPPSRQHEHDLFDEAEVARRVNAWNAHLARRQAA